MITILKIILLSTSEMVGNYLHLFKVMGKFGKRHHLKRDNILLSAKWQMLKGTKEKIITTAWEYCIFITYGVCKNALQFPPCCFHVCVTWCQFLSCPTRCSSANHCACTRKSFYCCNDWVLFKQNSPKHLRQDMWLWEVFFHVVFPELAVTLG